MRPVTLKTATRTTITINVAIRIHTLLPRLILAGHLKPGLEACCNPANNLTSGKPANDGQHERHDVRPALIVREDHLDEQDADRKAHDRSQDGTETRHPTS